MQLVTASNQKSPLTKFWSGSFIFPLRVERKVLCLLLLFRHHVDFFVPPEHSLLASETQENTSSTRSQCTVLLVSTWKLCRVSSVALSQLCHPLMQNYKSRFMLAAYMIHKVKQGRQQSNNYKFIISNYKLKFQPHLYLISFYIST